MATVVSAPALRVAYNQPFSVDIAISDVVDLGIYGAVIKFDPTMLSCQKIENLLPSLTVMSGYDNVAGLLGISVGSLRFTGSSPLFRITFNPLKEGISPLTFEQEAIIDNAVWRTELIDTNMNPIPFTTQDGSVTLSSTSTLRGYVYDETHSPIKDAEVTLSTADQVVGTGYTDNMGYYSVTVPLGTYTLKVTAAGYQPYTELNVNLTGGDIYTHSDIILALIPPDFTITASPDTLSIQQGDSAKSTIQVSSENGFNSPVQVIVSGIPPGITVTPNPFTITPPPNADATQEITVTVAAGTPTGQYTLTVMGISGSLVHSTTLSLNITPPPPTPDFSLDVAPASLQIQQGQSAQAQVTVTSINSFNSAVTLSLPAGVPEKPTGSFSPNPITPPPNETAQSTLTVLVSDAVPAGPYTLTIIGTSGTLEHTFNITVTVTAPAVPDFSLAASPSSVTVQQGNSAVSTITATSLQGFNSPIELSVSGQPSGVTATLNPTSITPPADGSVNSTLTIQVDPSTAPGTYPLTVTGTSGSLTHTTTVTLQVTAPPPPPPPPQLSTVTGIVTGILWRPISGAKVTLNGKTATTDSNGVYTIENVSNGTYTLTIESSLYETFKTSLDITEPGTYTVDAQLGLLNIKKTYLLTGGLIFGTIIIVGAIAAHRK